MDSFKLTYYFHDLKKEANTTKHNKLTAVEASKKGSEEFCTKGLLLALENEDREIQSCAEDALAERLSFLDTAGQDKHLEKVLDYCFASFSSGYSATVRSNVFRKVVDFLLTNRCSFEHHLLRLLTICRYLQLISYESPLVREVVWFQNRLAQENDRVSAKVAADLERIRRYSAYRNSRTPEKTLLEYLHKDHDILLTQLDREVFKVYGDLLKTQNSPNVLQRALANLNHWSNQIFNHTSNWQKYVPIIQKAASKGQEIGNLSIPLQRHVEIHMEFLRDTDLLDLILKKWLHDENLVVLALKITGKLTGIRNCPNEITKVCDLINHHGMDKQPYSVWQEIFKTLRSLFTGLNPKSPAIEQGEDISLSQRLFRARNLEGDEKIRKLLYELSQRKTLSEDVRKEAWKTLLTMIPPERVSYYQETLNIPENLFFFISLEVGIKTFQREIWTIIRENWNTIISQQYQERPYIINRLCKAFVRLANCEMVPFFIEIALDDPSLEVRNMAKEAVIQAGYEKQWLLAKLRQQLKSWRKELTNTENCIIRLNQEISVICDTIYSLRKNKADSFINIQKALQQREEIIATGWLDTAEIQMELKNLQTQLCQAVALAEQKQQEVLEFQREMERQLREFCEAESIVKNLINERNNTESELDSHRRRLYKVENQLQRYRSDLENLTRTPPSLPIRPNYSSDPETAQRQEQDFYRQQQQYKRKVSSWQNRKNSFQNEIQLLETNISNLKPLIARIENRIEELDTNISCVQRQYQHLESELQRAKNRFYQGQNSWQDIKQKINSLAQEVQRTKLRIETENSKQKEALAKNSYVCQQEQQNLQSNEQQMTYHSQILVNSQEEEQQQTTQAQALTQNIEQGRKRYDQLGAKAIPESALVENAAENIKQQHLAQHRQQEIAKFQYAHQLNRYLRGQNINPVGEK